MATVLHNLGALASQNHFLVYFFLYIAGIFAGNIAAFIGFWLALNHYLGAAGWLVVIPVLFAGDMTGDVLWYSLGRTLRGTRFGAWVAEHLPRRQKIDRYLQGHGKRWIYLSKFLYATSFPVMFMVGWSRADFGKFFRNSFLATLTWIPVLSLVASTLISALSYLQFTAALKEIELIFIFGLLLFLILEYGLVWFFERMAAER